MKFIFTRIICKLLMNSIRSQLACNKLIILTNKNDYKIIKNNAKKFKLPSMKKFNGNNCIFLLKNKDNQIMSFVFVGINEYKKLGNCLMIKYLHTFRQFANKGNGTCLIKFCIELAKNAKINNIVGSTLNKSYSLSIFKKLNFKQLDDHHFIYHL